MSGAHTDFDNSIFAQRPGLATERFANPKAGSPELASEAMAGIKPLGQILKMVVNGEVMDFLRNGPLLMLEGSDLKIPGLVSSALPQANVKTGRQRRIQDFAGATYQDWLVIGPLTQIVYCGVAPDSHLHLVNLHTAPNGQQACLLYREQQAGHGQLAIVAPGRFYIQ